MEYYSLALLEFQKIAEIFSWGVYKSMRTKGGDGNKLSLLFKIIFRFLIIHYTKIRLSSQFNYKLNLKIKKNNKRNQV
jgi:hypothetical protein